MPLRIEEARAEIVKATVVVEEEFKDLELRVGHIPMERHEKLQKAMERSAEKHLEETYEGRGFVMRHIIRPLHALGYHVAIGNEAKTTKRRMDITFTEYEGVLYVNCASDVQGYELTFKAAHEVGHFAMRRVNPELDSQVKREVGLMIQEGFGEYIAFDVMPRHRPKLERKAEFERLVLRDFAETAETVTARRYDPRAPYAVGYKYLSRIASMFGQKALIDFLKNPCDPREYIRARTQD